MTTIVGGPNLPSSGATPLFGLANVVPIAQVLPFYVDEYLHVESTYGGNRNVLNVEVDAQGATGQIVAIYGAAKSAAGNSIWGGTFLAEGDSGFSGANLFALEVDLNYYSGASAGNGAIGIKLGGVGSQNPGTAIQVQRDDSSTWVNGLVLSGVQYGLTVAGASGYALAVKTGSTFDTVLNGSGIFSTYGTLTTAGLGVTPVLGIDNRSGLTAADASPITIYTVPSSGGVFYLGASAIITTLLNSAGTYTLTYTDILNTTHTIVPMNGQTAAGQYTIAPVGPVSVKGGTNITVQLTGAFTSGAVSTKAAVTQVV